MEPEKPVLRPPPLIVTTSFESAPEEDPFEKEFHATVAGGNVDAVSALLDAPPGTAGSPYANLKVLVNSRDANEMTPLMKACCIANPRTQETMVNILLGHSADPRCLDSQGFTALHWAASTLDSVDTIGRLLTAGTAIDVLSDLGETPAHRAARFGRFQNLEKLLSLGANPAITNHLRQSVLDVAGIEKLGSMINIFSQRLIRQVILRHHPRLQTLVLHHDDCKGHSPKEGHQESPLRIDAILAALHSVEKFEGSDLVFSQNFRLASETCVKRAHSSDYYDLVAGLADQVAQSDVPVPFTPAVQRGLGLVPSHKVKLDETCDTSFSKGSMKATLRACGAVCHAVDAVISGSHRNAFCAVRPPGHHAGVSGLLVDSESHTSCGFCIFNSVAVGALHALEAHSSKVRKVAIVDWDIHHGNGTEEIVRKWAIEHPETTSLYFFSAHLYDVELKKRSGADGNEGTPLSVQPGDGAAHMSDDPDAVDGSAAGDAVDSKGSVGVGRRRAGSFVEKGMMSDDPSGSGAAPGIADGRPRHSVRIRRKRHRFLDGDSSSEPELPTNGSKNDLLEALDGQEESVPQPDSGRSSQITQQPRQRAGRKKTVSAVQPLLASGTGGAAHTPTESSGGDSVAPSLASSPDAIPASVPGPSPAHNVIVSPSPAAGGGSGGRTVVPPPPLNIALLQSPRPPLKSAFRVGGSSNDEKPHVFFQSAEPVSFEAGEYRLASPPTPLRSIHSDAPSSHDPLLSLLPTAPGSRTLLRRSVSDPGIHPEAVSSGSMNGFSSPIGSQFLRPRLSFGPFLGTSGISVGPLSPSPAARASTTLSGFGQETCDYPPRDSRPIPLWMRKPDSARAGGSDCEVAYAFYPGTGRRDLLEHNILNAPILPKWRERKPAPKSRHPAQEGAKHQSGRHAFRRIVSDKLLPSLRAFCPDLILISAGFDGGHRDAGNLKNVGRSTEGMDLLPEDYEWMTSKVVEISRYCCPGRVVSVLEGGYGSWKKEPIPDDPDNFKFTLDRSELAENCARHVRALAGIAQSNE